MNFFYAIAASCIPFRYRHSANGRRYPDNLITRKIVHKGFLMYFNRYVIIHNVIKILQRFDFFLGNRCAYHVFINDQKMINFSALRLIGFKEFFCVAALFHHKKRFGV